jgi:hypothetical protein
LLCLSLIVVMLITMGGGSTFAKRKGKSTKDRVDNLETTVIAMRDEISL